MHEQYLTVSGPVPEGWRREKIKYHLRRKAVRNQDGARILSLTRDRGVIPREELREEPAASAENLSEYLYVTPGDLVINKMKAWQGAVAVSDYEGIVSSKYYTYVFTDDAFDRRYFHYMIRSAPYVQQFEMLSGGIRVGQYVLQARDFEDVEVLIPPLEIQRAIGSFLDTQHEKASAITESVNAVVSKLTEYKHAFIVKAASGDSEKRRMKDSGLAWMPHMPDEWDLVPLRYLFEERDHKNINLEETNLLTLSKGDVQRKDITAEEGLRPASFRGHNVIEKGDLILRLIDLQNDTETLRTGISEERGIISSSYVALKPKGDINPKYFHYLLRAYDLKKVFYAMGDGIRQSISYDDISRNLVLPVPDINEQNYIVEKIEAMERSINAIIYRQKLVFQKTKEYLKSITAKAVSGNCGDLTPFSE